MEKESVDSRSRNLGIKLTSESICLIIKTVSKRSVVV